MTPRQRLLLIIPGVLFLVAFGAFELGRWGGQRIAERKLAAQESKAGTKAGPQDDAELMKTLFAQNLAERTFEFPSVISAATERKVHPFDPSDPALQTILGAIREAADEALATHNSDSSPIRGLRRINEASRHFEDSLREKIDLHPALLCTVPALSDGTEQRVGYPDLRIEHVESGTIVYLDPKLFEESSRDSSLRTFYYTPRAESSKVQDDACHLLLGISHDGADGQWTFTGWELIDLSKLRIKLKAEFQASNRDLYLDAAGVSRSGSTE